MSVEVLKRRSDNIAARARMRNRGLDFTAWTYKEEFRKAGWIEEIGDVNKSWDVLKGIEFIEKTLAPDSSILDIGAFCSEILCALHKLGYHKLAGTDLNPKITRMPYAHTIRYVVGDFMQTPFDDSFFDAVTAVSVIEHGFDSRKILGEVSRILKPGGFFILSVDYWPEKINTEGLVCFGMDWRIFSQNELTAFIEEAKEYGLHCVGSSDFEAREKTVDWNNKQYTFAWLTLQKENSFGAATIGRKEKVAFLSSYNQVCGIATHTGFICNELRQVLRHRLEYFHPIPFIFAENTSHTCSPDEELVFRCWHRNKDDFRQVKYLIDQLGITTLHIQYHVGLFGLNDTLGLIHFCRSLGTKTFITFHSSEYHLCSCAELVNASNRSFVHLEQSRIRLVAAGADPDLIRVVPHGVMGSHPAPMTQNEAKRRIGIPNELKLVSSLGFFEPHKGVMEIIQAFPKVIERQDAAFIFLGGPHPTNPLSAEYVSRCRSAAEELGIKGRVFLPAAFLPEELVSQYLSASDVIVLNYMLNRVEASGAAAFALAHARPMITSSAPPFKSLEGCTLQTSDFLDIATAVNIILANPTLSDYLVNQAEAFKKDHSFNTLSEILIEEYGKQVQAAPLPENIHTSGIRQSCGDANGRILHNSQRPSRSLRI